MIPNVLILQRSSRIGGGAQIDLIDLLFRRRELGFNPIVVCSRPGPLTSVLERENIKVYYLGIDISRGKPRDFFKWRNVARDLIQLVQKEDIHIIHTNSFWSLPYAFAVKRAHNNIKVICHIRRSYLEPRRIKKYHLGKADVLIPVCHYIKDILLHAGVEGRRIEVHYGYGNYESKISSQIKKPPEKESFIVGMVARIHKGKGMEYFIHSMSAVIASDHSVRFSIVGTGEQSYLQELMNLTKELGISEYVKFWGFQTDIFKFINEMDIVVLPTLEEGLGRSILESLAMGKPIVATDVGGIPELVIDGYNGFLVPPKDPGSLANNIIKFLEDKELCNTMGKASIRHYEDIYLSRDFGKQLAAIYRKLSRYVAE